MCPLGYVVDGGLWVVVAGTELIAAEVLQTSHTEQSRATDTRTCYTILSTTSTRNGNGAGVSLSLENRP